MSREEGKAPQWLIQLWWTTEVPHPRKSGQIWTDLGGWKIEEQFQSWWVPSCFHLFAVFSLLFICLSSTATLLGVTLPYVFPWNSAVETAIHTVSLLSAHRPFSTIFISLISLRNLILSHVLWPISKPRLNAEHF